MRGRLFGDLSAVVYRYKDSSDGSTHAALGLNFDRCVFVVA